MTQIIPKDYHPTLSVRDTEAAIVFIREHFQAILSESLNLQRMSAPMFVEKSTGLNDNLNGIERPVAFDMLAKPGATIEVVHSLAKWKRLALKRYGFGMHEGLYTNMNAIRRDEELDNFHSIYVDQWDWEKIITKEERTEATLKATVEEIFAAIKQIEHEVTKRYPGSTYRLPDKVTLKVTQCDPAVKGDTKTNALKDATVETGYTLKVPMFVNEGDSIIVSTATGKYDSRA